MAAEFVAAGHTLWSGCFAIERRRSNRIWNDWRKRTYFHFWLSKMRPRGGYAYQVE